MPNFAYAAPTSVEEAVALLGSQSNARPLAGGTDLLVQLQSGRLFSPTVIDLKRIPGLTGITRRNGAFIIGAATPCAVVGEDLALATAWPGVVEAAKLIGSTQVQSRATMAGNLCNASPAADSVPAMIAAGAICGIAGVAGRCELPVEKLPLSPGRNALARDEFVTEIILPAQPARSGDAYLRATPRTEMDIAAVGAGVNLTLDASGIITHARVALGAVAPTAVLVEAAGACLIGTQLDDAALARLEEIVAQACKPIDDKRGTAAYRIAIARVLARRAAKVAFLRAEQRA